MFAIAQAALSQNSCVTRLVVFLSGTEGSEGPVATALDASSLCSHTFVSLPCDETFFTAESTPLNASQLKISAGHGIIARQSFQLYILVASGVRVSL